ncbi:MAG: hypothetical protein NC916_02680, partial [Candidatus Omnitrophica bacterium]|nr:hypothetical protein [Candidatus Omnitrophota bacterium]
VALIGGGLSSAWNSFEGPYFGLKLNAPFTIPEFPDNPFALKLTVGYGPRIDIKSRTDVEGIISPPVSYSTKGYYLEARAALSWKIFKGLYLEGAYNYFRFKQTKDSDDLGVDFLGLPVTVNAVNQSLTMHGPSLQARYEF